MAAGKRRNTMRSNQILLGIKMMLATLVLSLLFVGTAQAQGELTVYFGKFTLAHQVQWGKSVLLPGNYTITIESTATPVIALVQKADGHAAIRVMSGVLDHNTNGINALLIKDKDGRLTVHSLSLAQLGMVLIYDPSLAQEPVQEARLSQSVPVLWARK
jgi:hypothetical protein